jgi:hypothetical protein
MTLENSPRQVTPREPPSHVHGLLERLAASPSKIAPERVAELKALVQKHGIELQVKDGGETSFEMGAMFGLVFTPMRVYHHLWSAALYFAALYIERETANNAGKTEIDLNPLDIETVWGNYLLSCECLKDNSSYPLPPNATEITPRQDYIALADELFLRMVAFCLLHEIAHLESGDSKTDEGGAPLNQIEPHQMEFAADKWAYDWILTRWSESSTDPRDFIKRTLGIIFTLAMMDEFRHHLDHTYASSHPGACDRLLQFFNDYKAQIDANEWGATCLTAAFIGLQAIAIMNKYILPTVGFSDPISFLNLAKVEMPRLAAAAKARRPQYEAEEAKKRQTID